MLYQGIIFRLVENLKTGTCITYESPHKYVMQTYFSLELRKLVRTGSSKHAKPGKNESNDSFNSCLKSRDSKIVICDL